MFDAGGHRWGEAALSVEQLRARALIARRQAAINRSLAEYRSFDPLILEPDEEAAAEAGVESMLDATTRAILPWVAGFEFAASIFPGLDDVADDAVATALARLYRFLPAEADDERATAAIVVAERPLATLDDAIDEVRRGRPGPRRRRARRHARPACPAHRNRRAGGRRAGAVRTRRSIVAER